MYEWWETLSVIEKAFCYIAVPSTVVFILQMVLTFFGIGDGYDVDGDGFGGHLIGFDIFTFRNFITFFTVFSWAGIAGLDWGFPLILVLIGATFVGVIVVLIISSLFYFTSRLSESGTMSLSGVKGCKGTVYLKIPGEKSGKGQIQIVVNGSLRTLDAITLERELLTGEAVEVVDVIDDQVLLVQEYKNEKGE